MNFTLGDQLFLLVLTQPETRTKHRANKNHSTQNGKEIELYIIHGTERMVRFSRL